MTVKKIVHAVEDMKTGGLEKTVFYIALNLDKSKYDIEVWCLASGGEIADELIQSGITVNILGLDNYHNPVSVIALARLFRKKKIDIIHTHGYFASTFGRLAAICAGVPVIITHVHSTYYNYNKRNILIEKYLSYFTCKIICPSRAIQDFVVEHEGINKNRTVIIYNGISEPETAGSLPKTLECAENGGIVIMTVASLTENKGHKVLIDAFRQVYDKYPKLRLVIIGDGPLRKELETYTNKLPCCRKITFLGQRKDVFSLLRLADIFVLATILREGLGIALIEAMAAGLPVIGTRLGGIPEIIENNANGLLVAPKDASELAFAIEKLACNKKMRESMGKIGRIIYKKKFTVAKMIEKLDKLYENSGESNNCILNPKGF